MTHFAIAAAVAAAVLVASSAHAQNNNFIFSGDPDFSAPVSGQASTDTINLFIDPNRLPFGIPPNSPVADQIRQSRETMGVGSIDVRERGDDPCHVLVGYHFTASGFPPSTQLASATCSNNLSRRNGNTSGNDRAVISSKISIANSVQVCLNNSKVKGVELRGAPARCIADPNASGCFVATALMERTNCPNSSRNDGDGAADWSTSPSACQPITRNGVTFRSAMVGVQLHMRSIGNNGRRAVRGMRAICKAVEQT